MSIPEDGVLVLQPLLLLLQSLALPEQLLDQTLNFSVLAEELEESLLLQLLCPVDGVGVRVVRGDPVVHTPELLVLGEHFLRQIQTGRNSCGVGLLVPPVVELPSQDEGDPTVLTGLESHRHPGLLLSPGLPHRQADRQEDQGPAGGEEEGQQ